MLKQQLETEMTQEDALIFSRKALSQMFSKNEGQKITCPCCGMDEITGSFKWVRCVAAIKAVVTKNGGSVKNSMAAIKANQTRKIVKSAASSKKVSLIKKIKVIKQTKIEDTAVQKTLELKRTDLLLDIE